MHYFRNFELAKQYHVSQTAVGKWVEAAKNGRLDLQLVEEGAKSYIAATSKNRAVIEEVIRSRKKYLNSKSHKVLRPKNDFYVTFMPEQINDIILSLDRDSNIPLQYVYIGEGAKYWDQRVQRSLSEDFINDSNKLVNQLILNRSFFDNLFNNNSVVNVVDVGAGNAYPIKNLLTFLQEHKKLGHYQAVDISAEMLALAETNIKKWFGDTIDFRADIKDVSCEHFGDLTISATPLNDNEQIVNLVVFIGSTLGNFDKPSMVLHTIYRSLNPNDIFIYCLKLDTYDNRRIFDVTGKDNRQLAPNLKNLLENLGIDESVYNIETGYDEIKKERFAKIKFNVSITMLFDLPQGERAIKFKKDESVTVWKYRHYTSQEITQLFNDCGFNVLHSSQTSDHEYMLMICDVQKTRRSQK